MGGYTQGIVMGGYSTYTQGIVMGGYSTYTGDSNGRL